MVTDVIGSTCILRTSKKPRRHRSPVTTELPAELLQDVRKAHTETLAYQEAQVVQQPARVVENRLGMYGAAGTRNSNSGEAR